MTDFAAWVPTIIATAAATIAFWQAFEARKDRLMAERAASAATAEAKRSADAAERSAGADERLARLAEAEAARRPIPWRLEASAGHLFRLTNTADERMASVDVEPLSAKDDFRTDEFPADIDGRSSRSFVFAPSLASPPAPRVRISWTWPDGSTQSWTEAIPGRR